MLIRQKKNSTRIGLVTVYCNLIYLMLTQIQAGEHLVLSAAGNVRHMQTSTDQLDIKPHNRICRHNVQEKGQASDGGKANSPLEIFLSLFTRSSHLSLPPVDAQQGWAQLTQYLLYVQMNATAAMDNIIITYSNRKF